MHSKLDLLFPQPKGVNLYNIPIVEFKVKLNETIRDSEIEIVNRFEVIPDLIKEPVYKVKNIKHQNILWLNLYYGVLIQLL